MVGTTTHSSPSGGARAKVIREIDVCLCNGVLGTDTQVGNPLLSCVHNRRYARKLTRVLLAQLYLLQYPLRPPWRPYSFEGCDKV